MKRMIEQQVNRVWRRLFLATLLAHLAWGWSAALLLSAVWFFVQPYLLAGPPDWLRWAVLAASLVAATVTAVTLAVRRRPSSVSAALSLDEKFELKERATTALTLTDADLSTQAGQALLADAEGRVAPLRVGDRFPVTLPLKAASLLPLGALAVVLLAILWNPDFSTGRPTPEDEVIPPADAQAKIDEQMKKLAPARPPEKKPGEPVAKKEDLEKINADLEKFTRKPRETREQVRERIKDAVAIEDEIRRRQQEQAERVDAFKEQMKQAERLARKKREQPKGPGDKLANALARGDMDRAADELQRLSKEMQKAEEIDRLRKKAKDPKENEEERKKAQEEADKLEKEQNLTKKDREALQKQLEDLENQLKELTRDKVERKKELDEMAERGEIDKDQLDREKDEIDKNADKLTDEEKKEIEELAKELGECKECCGKEGKEGEACKKLGNAAKKAGKMSKEGAQKQLAEKMAQVKAVRKAMARAMGGGANPASGRRPESKEKDDWKSEEKWSPAEWNKGRTEVVGDGPKGGFKGPRKPAEMQAEIEAAAEQAPAAIDRQRLPPAARKMARGYFEKVRGAEKDGKKP